VAAKAEVAPLPAPTASDGSAGARQGPGASPSVGRNTLNAPQFTPCQIQDLRGIAVYSAECTDFDVLENAADPTSRRIKLRVARVPAINRRNEPDPLFLLAGGPGMAATTLYGSAASAFARIHRNRDIVLVDQRGTGSSNPLNCAIDDVEMMGATAEMLNAEVQRCREVLSTRADLAYYTTSVAVQDLERVRAALGYDRINLYGGSYGTRVASHYLRRFPERTRTVILDGVVAPQQALGPDTAIDAENALQSVFARCKRDEACSNRFGDPAATYRALRASLEAKPVTVNLSDPSTAAPTKLEFGPFHLAVVLRLSTYNSEQAALLPLAIDLAQNAGNFVPIAGQFLLTVRQLGDIAAFGMHNAVVCTEDVPFYNPENIDRAKLNATFMGTSQLDALQNICKDWPRGPIDADLHTPLRSDVPVLLLSGGNDPVTPAANGELTKAGLTRSLHLVLPDLGHGQIGAPCMDRVMADFLRLGTLDGLDASCTKRVKPMPFFISLAGPTP
jgi:pimeloyl-ACP methyl ester carboxylesterase